MKFLSRKQVCAIISLSRATIDRKTNEGCFPKPVRLGQGRVAYVEEEVLGWMDRRITERDEHTDS